MRASPRPGPLLRASVVRALRGLIKAAPAGFPYPGHGSLALRQAQGERKEIDKGGSRGDAETRRGCAAPQAISRSAKVPPRSTGEGKGAGAAEATSLRVSAPPRAKLPSLDLKAAPSAMDARFAKPLDKPRPSTGLRVVDPLAPALADPCARCEGRWPIVRLHPIVAACIETPCPMKALLA